MANCAALFCFALLFSWCQCDQKLLIDKLRWDFLRLEDNLWNKTSSFMYTEQEKAEQELVMNFYEFDQVLKQIPEDLLYGTKPFKAAPDFLELYADLKYIKNVYDKFRHYQTERINSNKVELTIEDLIYDIINNQTGVVMTAQRIHHTVYKNVENFVNQVHSLTDDEYWCKVYRQSPQQLFYNLYNLISLYELKAYVLTQFAYLGGMLLNQGVNLPLSIQARKTFESKTTEVIRTMNIKMKSPKDIWRCDPKMYVKGSNYDEFTRLLQGHIQNEVDLSSWGTCRNTCGDYTYGISYGCYDYHSDVCRKTERCTGHLIGCFFVESHASICVSNNKNTRRYDYVQFKSGKTLGKNTHCPDRKSVHSWQRWFVRCHYCMCLCDQQGPLSDRYISLRPVNSDIKQNKVVTGLRLIKHNRILHLQIQEGQLLPYGYINQSTVNWVDVDNYKVTDKGVKNGEDFFTLTYGSREMVMNEIQTHEENRVLTGVRFQLIKSKIQIVLQAHSFDWTTGSVNPRKFDEIQEITNQRTKYSIDKSDVPTYAKRNERRFPNQSPIYIEFTHTDFDKDAAQTTIPFIDTQKVVNEPAVPLIGAGIYYKGQSGYGGFIAPMIRTFDYGRYMSNKLPQMSERVFNDLNVEIN